jgi:hypoxanthine phosphoribosyltransferase
VLEKNMDKINVLINEEEIDKKLDELSEKIMTDYKDKPLMFICVLKGASVFMVELAKKIKNPIEYEFIRASSYTSNKESSGIIKLSKDVEIPITGKDVIIIEDILDTGRTLARLKDYFSGQKPNSLKICTLLDKPDRRVVPIDLDYVGFTIPDEFVVGFGMDYNEKYRNLPYIGAVNN